MHELDRVIECLGSDAALAAVLGISAAAVAQWRRRGTQIRAEFCSAIEKATHGKVTRKDLRPDDWHLIWPELARKRKKEGAHG